MKPLQDMEMRLAEVKEDVISFQTIPLSSIASFAQHSQPKQQQYLGGQPRPPLVQHVLYCLILTLSDMANTDESLLFTTTTYRSY